MCEISRAWRTSVFHAVLLQMKLSFDGLGDAFEHSFRYATPHAEDEYAIRIAREQMYLSLNVLVPAIGH